MVKIHPSVHSLFLCNKRLLNAGCVTDTSLTHEPFIHKGLRKRHNTLNCFPQIGSCYQTSHRFRITVLRITFISISTLGWLKDAAENCKSCLREKTPPSPFTPNKQEPFYALGLWSQEFACTQVFPRGNMAGLWRGIPRHFLGTTVNTQKTRLPPSITSVCRKEACLANRRET